MQDKITQLIKYISIFTTDPDRDWRRIFIGLVAITLGVSAWSFFFYLQVNQDIQASVVKRPKNAGAIVSEQGDELRHLIAELDAKKLKNDAVIKGEYATVISNISDPSR